MAAGIFMIVLGERVNVRLVSSLAYNHFLILFYYFFHYSHTRVSKIQVSEPRDISKIIAKRSK